MGDEDDDDDSGGPTIPKAKFDALRGKWKQQIAENADLKAQLAKLEPLAVNSETLTRRISEIEGQRDAERAGRVADRAVHAKGITDPEGIDFLHQAFGRLDPKNRPEFGTWLDQQIAAPPKWLGPYLPDKGDGAKGDGDGKAGAGSSSTGSTGAGAGAGASGNGQRPNPNGGVVHGGGGGAGAKPTQAEIEAARTSALRGDRAPWDAVQARLGQAPLPKLD
jgi:hypothetical protein